MLLVLLGPAQPSEAIYLDLKLWGKDVSQGQESA